ncbi:hypothetical protein [Streptomyces sp. cg35]|uniref:hypothetical protein n=1 Tax=Streptomyces sp. cg35 TaxID=3421650 RepID=UPI003D1644C7
MNVEFEDSRLHIGWQVPDFFRHLPVLADVNPAELADQIVALTQEIFPERSDDEKYEAALTLLAQTGEMIEAGVQYAGLCLAEFDPGRPSLATVIAQRVERDPGDVREVAHALAGRFERRYPYDEVSVVELPYGPVAVRIGQDRLALPVEPATDGPVTDVPRNFIQAHIPVPDDMSVQTLELSTTCVEDWDAYARMFAEILKTVEWATADEMRQAREEAAPAPDDETRRRLAAASRHVWELTGVTALPSVGFAPELDRMTLVSCPACDAAGEPARPCTPEHRWALAPLREPEARQLVERVLGKMGAQGWRVDNGTNGRRYAVDPAPGGARVGMRYSGRSAALHVDVSTGCARGGGAAAER